MRAISSGRASGRSGGVLVNRWVARSAHDIITEAA
jgi:hypothetical protein